MCTVSWFHESRGYQLFCNRDERLTRAQAFTPQKHSGHGVSFIAPRDGEAGGTWIAVNEFGISLCLLNGWTRGWCRGEASRGLIIMDLMAARSLDEMSDRLSRLNTARFSPFTLVALETGRDAIVAVWNGRALRVTSNGEAMMPLSSSSVDQDGAAVARREILAGMIAGGGRRASTFLAFHRSHQPDAGPHSPCMHRADAESVSFTWVTVRPGEASLYYAAGAPCRSLAGSSVTIPAMRQEAARCQPCC